MRSALALLVALSNSACGTVPSDDSVGPDSAPHLAQTIDVLPLCQTYTWEAKVGQVVRQRVTNRVAMIDGIEPDASFSVEACYSSPPVVTYPCPAGTACVGSQWPALPGPHCGRSLGGGLFEAGRLMIQCGYVIQDFDASGAETSHRESASYTSLRVTIY